MNIFLAPAELLLIPMYTNTVEWMVTVLSFVYDSVAMIN